jgi:hypothetical protein
MKRKRLLLWFILALWLDTLRQSEAGRTNEQSDGG